MDSKIPATGTGTFGFGAPLRNIKDLKIEKNSWDALRNENTGFVIGEGSVSANDNAGGGNSIKMLLYLIL